MACAAGVVERPDEGRTRVEVAGQLGKPDVVGAHAGDDLAADLPDRRVVVAQQPRRDVLFARFVVGAARPHQRDITADVLAQQLVRLEQVVLVVLLEHVHARRLAQRAEVHGCWIDGRGNVHEMQVGGSPSDLQIADVTNERDVGVVDGDGQFDLIVERRGRRGILCLCGGPLRAGRGWRGRALALSGDEGAERKHERCNGEFGDCRRW